VKYLEYCLAVSDNHYFSDNPQSTSAEKLIDIELGESSVSVFTDSGVFSPLSLDKGTAVLLSHIELATDQGKVMDLGSGWGPISLALALQNKSLDVIAVEINPRANQLLDKNASHLGIENIQKLQLEQIAENSVDEIWSNPPIRIGKKQLHELLIEAFSKLKPGASAYLVVQKHLGSDSLAKWIEAELSMDVIRIDSHKGFRVLMATKPQ